MNTNVKEYGLQVVGAIILSFALGVFFGWGATERSIRASAVKAGVGEFSTTTNASDSEFRWINKTNVYNVTNAVALITKTSTNAVTITNWVTAFRTNIVTVTNTQVQLVKVPYSHSTTNN